MGSAAWGQEVVLNPESYIEEAEVVSWLTSQMVFGQHSAPFNGSFIEFQMHFVMLKQDLHIECQ